MSKINRMTGTPWHVDILRKEEDDTRRHRTRCSYYRKEGEFCSRMVSRCPGSAHCKYYSEKMLPEQRKKKSRVNAEPFKGKKLIDLTDISIPAMFYRKKDSKQIGNLIKHYKKHHELLGAIVVQTVDGKYELVSGFSTCEAARILMIDRVEAFYRTPIKERTVKIKAPFKLNQWVEHVGHGIGRITSLDDEFVTVKYDNGKEKTYLIETCIEHKYLKNL